MASFEKVVLSPASRDGAAIYALQRGRSGIPARGRRKSGCLDHGPLAERDGECRQPNDGSRVRCHDPRVGKVVAPILTRLIWLPLYAVL
jgi:hypothetical protein